jgi:hypothetical protein
VDVKDWCPVPLLGNFTYSHNDGSTTTCGALTSNLNVCPSWTTMTYNYTQCSTIQAFSGKKLSITFYVFFKRFKEKNNIVQIVLHLFHERTLKLRFHLIYSSCLAEGILYCLKYVVKSSTIFLSVLNPGDVDNIVTHRFTCYVSLNCHELYII